MKGHLIHLFEYNRWANDLVIEALKRPAEADPRCLELLTHIIAAAEVWLARLHGKTPHGATWPQWSLEECERTAGESYENWVAYLRAAQDEDLKAPIAYVNSKGETFSNSVKEIVTQVVNHGTYHRGQIAARLRALGEELPETDYIFYVRQHPKPGR